MAEKKTYKLSSRGRRFAAAVIDSIIPWICLLIVIIAAVVIADSASYYNSYSYDYGYDDYSSIVGGSIAVLVSLILSIAFLVVEIIFYAKSQSIGKAILGMKVVSSKNGKPIGIWWMLLRELIVKQACANVFLLGYIWILIDKKNRGWHDKILDTYVVDIKPVHKTTPVPEAAPAAAAAPVREDYPVEEVVEQEKKQSFDLVELMDEPVTGYAFTPGEEITAEDISSDSVDNKEE